MSVDKLVDSTQLDASLTYEAGKIRAKLGSSAQLDFDLANGKGFGDYIDAIPTGGGGNDDDILSGSLTGIYENSTVTELRYGAFYDCKTVQQIILPSVTKMGEGVFRNCQAVTLISAVNCIQIVNYLINGCNNLLTVALPKVNELRNNALEKSTSIKTIDILGGKINGNAFNGDTSLDTLIIRAASVSNLVNVSAFNNTPFASGGSGGTIYIPKALYDHLGDGSSSDYRNQTNWGAVYNYGTITFAKIEGSIYENAYADGTPIS